MSQTKINRWLSIFSLFVGAAMLLFGLFVFQRYRRLSGPVVEKPIVPKTEVLPTTNALPYDVLAKVAVWRRLPDILAQHESLRARQQFDLAEERLRKALEAAPRSLALHLALARLLMDRGRYGEALEPLVQALEIQPADLPVRLMLGTALERMGQYESSLGIAQWILEADPYSEEAHRMATEAYWRTDRFQQAIPHLRKIVNLNSGDLEAQNRLGEAYSRGGDYQRAVQSFQDIIKQDPVDATAFFNLAACHARQSLTNQVIEVLKRAVPVFGRQKVREWAKAREFDAMRAEPFFQALAESSAVTGDESDSGKSGP